MRALLLALAFVLAAAPAFAQSPATHPPAGWKTWTYPDLHVSFRAPPGAQPKVAYAKIDIGGGLQVSNDQITVLGDDHQAYMIGVSDWTGNDHPITIDGVPAGVVKGMNGQIIGVVRTTPWPGGEARDYDLKTATLVGRNRAIVVARRLIQVTVLSDTGAVPADAEAFVTSVAPLP